MKALAPVIITIFSLVSAPSIGADRDSNWAWCRGKPVSRDVCFDVGKLNSPSYYVGYWKNGKPLGPGVIVDSTDE